jgi:hypothetical protein
MATVHKYLGERTVCAPRAEILQDGIPYVAGWSAAQRATTALARSLGQAALASGFGALRADVNVHGQGVVCIGTIPADVVQQLVTLLTEGLCAELQRSSSSNPLPD